MNKKIIVVVIVLVVCCLGYWGPLNSDHFAHHSLMEELEHNHTSAATERGHGLLDEIDTTEFIRIHSKHENIKDFFVDFRTTEITSFPCQNCHDRSLDILKSESSEVKNAHWDIKLDHADLTVMTCITCHDADNMNMLKSIQGESISLDRSFEMCSQCHSTQYMDWEGGAHGKNLSGWNSTRVVKTCIGCHEPHKPKIESRWPSRLVSK